jgi:NADP-dependent 3-hydroxy acid dehydrogenase YdfG
MARAPRSLAGAVVAITGGARGIGRATAEALVAHGAHVAIGDIEAPLAEQAARELGAGTIGLPLDVTERGSFDGFLRQVEERLGPLDVLINNAGIMPIGPFVKESDATAARLVDVNLHGVILGSKLALARFLARGCGHLVNIASTAGKAGFPGGATYCATKHAVVGLSEAIRAEVRGTRIQVSVVMPVVVKTELGSGLPQPRAFKAVGPEEVAAAIVGALQFPRFDVFVPASVGRMFWAMSLLPRSARDVVARALRADRVLMSPDHLARADYEARIARTIAAAEAGAVAPAPTEDAVPAPPPAAAAAPPEAAAREHQAV